MSNRKGKTRYTGKEVWVNQATGEVREVDTFEKPVGRGNGFMITYLAEIINLVVRFLTMLDYEQSHFARTHKKYNQQDNRLVCSRKQFHHLAA